MKLAAVRCCQSGFSVAEYLKAISSAEIGAKPKREKNPAPAYSEADIGHPELFLALKEWRSRKAKEANVPHYQILHQKTLVQIAVNLPDTLPALAKLKGIGKKLAVKYGKELVALVADYRGKNDIREVVLPTPPAPQPEDRQELDEPAADTVPKGPKVPTRQTTLALLDQGLTVAEIAEKRGFAVTTIESHLAHCIEMGEIVVDRLLATEKHQALERIILPHQDKKLSEIKEAAGDACTYGEIRYVLAHQKYLANKP